jgi:hypothetical protein
MSSPLSNLERALRVMVAVLALAIAILANVRATAEERWRRVAVVEDVAVTVVEVSELKLASLQHMTDARSLIDKGARASRHGFSELRRNVSTGAYRCTVYVTAATNTPEVLEHETRHCHGWVHR